VDLIFVARVVRIALDTELIVVDTVVAKWPLVRMDLRPHHGWKLDPRTFPHEWYPDTGGSLMASMRPEDSPGLSADTWILVYMKIGYPEEVVAGVHHLLKNEPMLQLARCGLRASADTGLGTRLYGPPSWSARSP